VRWHSFVVIGQWIDHVVEILSLENTPIKDALKLLIDSRKGIARALSDPITYRLGSGSMHKIYDMGLEMFRMRDIQLTVTQKFEVVDRLYRNLFEQKRAKELEHLSRTIFNKEI
jgi:hypothetical protein